MGLQGVRAVELRGSHVDRSVCLRAYAASAANYMTSCL